MDKEVEHELRRAHEDLREALQRLDALMADDGTAPAPGTMPWLDTVAIAARHSDRAARHLRKRAKGVR